MKHEKLKEIYGKQHDFMTWGLLCTLPMMAGLAVVLVCAFYKALHLDEGFVILGLISIVCMVLNIIFGRKETKYSKAAEDYIILKIMEIINANGIGSNCFEIIQESYNKYVVGFHNQKVDYEDLQSKIDYELHVMNEIAHKSIQVRLI